MPEKKRDLRIKKTQRLLAFAMLALLEKNSFGKITVNDLCTEAMVSRSTFYAHFEDKYALLRFCLEILDQRMFEEHEGASLEEWLRHILLAVQENEKLFRNLLMADLDVELMEMLRKSFHEDFTKLLKAYVEKGTVLPGPTEVMSVYYASGLTSAIILWVGKGMPYSVDEMARCLAALLPDD